MAWVTQCVTDHGAALERYALSLCGRADLAADAVQETFVRLLRADRQQIADHVLPWLLRVCRTRVLDLLRAQGRTLQVSDALAGSLADTAAPDPAQSAQRRDDTARVLAHMQSLPHNQQEVVRLKFLNDLSYKEIAEVTGLSVSNVGFLLHTALARLRSMLSGEQTAVPSPANAAAAVSINAAAPVDAPASANRFRTESAQ